MIALAVFSGDLWAGAEVMIFNLLAQLRGSGSVHPVALALNDGYLTQRLRELEIETHVIPESRCSFPQIVFRALRLLGGRRVHVIHSHRYKENLLAYLLSLVLRPRLLLATVHGLPEPSDRHRWRADHVTRLNHLLLKRRFAHVVAVSRDIERRLVGEIGLAPARVSVIHNGVCLPAIPHGAAAPPCGRRYAFHVGTVGRLVPVKDFGLFLGTAAAVRQRFPGARFSILGDGPLRAQLAHQRTTLGLAGCVELLAPVPDPLPYYRSLDVYMNTSRHEGIPMSVLEAMACGVPIVAADVGGIPEIVSHGREGLLVGTRSATDFAAACAQLLEDETSRRAFGERARSTVTECFSASVMARRYVELYRSAGEVTAGISGP